MDRALSTLEIAKMVYGTIAPNVEVPDWQKREMCLCQNGMLGHPMIKGDVMTLEQLEGEKAALLDFKQWLEEKLMAVEIDLACNEEEAEELLNAMEREAKN